MKTDGMDHRVRVTQELIRKAFTELFTKKPIQSISIKELCERAGINRGTFYAHYQDIYDLRDQMQEDMYRDIQQTLSPLLGEDAHASQMEITVGVFQWMKENSDLCAMVLGEYGDKAFLLKVINLGRIVCKDNYLRSFTNASPERIEWFYAFASSGCIGLLRKWLLENMETPAREIAGMAEQLIVNGLGYLQG
ncbi:MAG: TetR/AcrR family transcriptional regulator [Clostridia bacterium]